MSDLLRTNFFGEDQGFPLVMRRCDAKKVSRSFEKKFLFDPALGQLKNYIKDGRRAAHLCLRVNRMPLSLEALFLLSHTHLF